MSAMNGSIAYDGTPPTSHDHEGSPSGDTTPAPQGDGPGTPYMAVQNGRKRKADGTSSRGVANLTPEQLAKKRANDREAQRAIRERTKSTIEGLEKRIKELESQAPVQQLREVQRSRDAVQAENEELKRRMQSILGLLQPMTAAQAASQGLNDLAAATARQSPLPMAPPPQAHMYQVHPTHPSQQPQHALQSATYIQPQPQQQLQYSYDNNPFSQQHIHPDLRNNHPSPTPQRPLAPATANGQGQLQYQGQPQHDMRMWAQSSAAAPVAYNQQAPPQLPLSQEGQSSFSSEQSQQQSDRYNVHQIADDVKLANAASKESRRRDLIPAPSDEPLYQRLPLNVEPTCTLDGVLKGFEEERRRAAQSGTPAASLVGPAYPSISSLLNPTRAAKSHPLSKVFTDILGRFPSIDAVPEQVAVLYIMFLIMRWHIAPTQENFERLPEWARPVRSQLEIPHPAWIDHLPWPMMRDCLVRSQSPSKYPFDNFFVPFTTTLSLNWPYEPSQCLLSNNSYRENSASSISTPQSEGTATTTAGAPRSNTTDATSAIESAINGTDDGEEFMINPVYESHLRNLDNWSLGSAFKNTFPDLVDDVRLKDVKKPASASSGAQSVV